MNLLRPRETVPSILEIDFARLRRLGMTAVLFDLDKTLKERGPAGLEPAVLALLEHLDSIGFRVGILTNRRHDGDPLLNVLGDRYPLRHAARKPWKRGFLWLLRELGAAPHQAVMVGDRLLTDVLGANRLGIYSIRVRPTLGTSRHRPARTAS